MELATQVEMLLKQAEAQTQLIHKLSIQKASRVFDELVTKGLIEAPSYRLTPINNLPPKTVAFYKQR